jgi:hypothetical protein
MTLNALNIINELTANYEVENMALPFVLPHKIWCLAVAVGGYSAQWHNAESQLRTAAVSYSRRLRAESFSRSGLQIMGAGCP